MTEFAIIAPLLFALLLGIVDFGVALNDLIAVRQGAREGARQAVTGRVGSDTSCTPVPATPNPGVEKLVCLVKDRLDLDEDRTRVKINVESPYGEGKALQVCVMASLESVSGLYSVFLDGRVTRSAVQMRVEQTTDEAAGVDVDDLVSYEETPFSGSSWSCAIEPAG